MAAIAIISFRDGHAAIDDALGPAIRLSERSDVYMELRFDQR